MNTYAYFRETVKPTITVSPDGQTKTIEVTIDKSFVESIEHSALRSGHIVSELRRCGIPVKGNLFLQGIEHGRLEISEDALGFKYQFRWVGRNDPDDDEI